MRLHGRDIGTMIWKAGQYLVVVVMLSALICGCTPPGRNNSNTTPAAHTITITETEMKFTPNHFTVKVGETATIQLVNKGIVLHDFTIDNWNGQQISKPLPAGQSTTFTLTAPTTPGTVEFYCSQPGHREAGMKGTIAIQ